MKKVASILAAAGLASSLSAQTIVTADITSDTTWSGTVILESTTFVKNDATLTILPGTIVRGQPRTAAGIAGAPGSLIVTQDGFINAAGNAGSPIIFTTAAVDNDSNGIPDDADSSTFLDAWTSGDAFYDADPAGAPLGPLAAGPIPGATGNGPDANVELWGGLIILGSAPTNLGTATNPTAIIGNIEGLPASADTEYGGKVANDNSGVLQFVSVRHGGSVLGSANEINGITLGGVGFGTTIEFCEVYLNWDDGFEWFGGTVNGRYLSASFVGDDHFDGDQGFTGQLQYVFAVAPYFAGGSSGGDEACEFDGDDAGDGDINTDLNGADFPIAGYSVANFTFVGPTGATGFVGAAGGNEANGRITLRDGYSGELYNGFVVNTTAKAFSIDTAYDVVLDTITLDDTTDAGAPSNAGSGVLTVNNLVPAQGTGLVGEDQAVIGGLDPRPATGFLTPGLGSSLTLGLPFETTTYTGAFEQDAFIELWTTGWTALNARGILVD